MDKCAQISGGTGKSAIEEDKENRAMEDIKQRSETQLLNGTRVLMEYLEKTEFDSVIASGLKAKILVTGKKFIGGGAEAQLNGPFQIHRLLEELYTTPLPGDVKNSIRNFITFFKGQW